MEATDSTASRQSTDGRARTGDAILPVQMGTPRELILASTSESRREILQEAGMAFRVEAPDFDEQHPEGLDSAALAEGLALGKARSIAARFPEARVIGADQILDCEGDRSRKPSTEAAARAQLKRLRGRTHELCTGIALVCAADGIERVAHETTRLAMRALTDDEIDRYLATGEWRGCLGSYRVEGRGAALFERIDGDLFNARGLPLPRLRELLRLAGA
jgi:septum formation protein